MLPLLAAAAAPLIAGAFGAIGQNASNQSNSAEAAKARAFNSAEAEKNRQFQDQQSSTAYQRKVKDLEAAGLNPMLAYEGGGAQAMSGSAASGTAARMENTLGAGVSGAQSAVQLQSAVMDARQRRLQSAAQTAESVERASLTRAQADQVRMMSESLVEKLRGEIGLSSAQAQNIRQRYTLDAQRQDYERDLTLARTARERTQLKGDVSRNTLLELAIPSARNVAGAANTAWGRYVTPYLSDAVSAQRIFTPWMMWAK